MDRQLDQQRRAAAIPGGAQIIDELPLVAGDQVDGFHPDLGLAHSRMGHAVAGQETPSPLADRRILAGPPPQPIPPAKRGKQGSPPEPEPPNAQEHPRAFAAERKT